MSSPGAAAGAVVGFILLTTVVLAGGAVTPNGRDAFGTSVRPGSVPAPYQALVTTAGRVCTAASPSILAAQLETESGWNPAARSPAGAVGIAQFMPATWARWGRDGNRDGRADPLDPRDAIPAQAAYDCALAAEMERALRLGRVRGRIVDLMLAAYNAGPDAVLTAGGVPPIAETREYVTRIVDRAPAFALPTASRRDADGFRNRLLAAAMSQTGVPYAWGGGTTSGPSAGPAGGSGVVGYDCSGLVRFAVYQASGGTLLLPRSAEEQSHAGTPVPLDQLQPGDVVAFVRPGERVAHHIGIYAGDGRMINAPSSGGRVRTESLETDSWRNHQWRAVRFGR